VLVIAFSVVAVDAVLQSATPSLKPLGTIVFLTMAAGLGTASGATFALVAQRAPADRVGSVTGIVGAAGGLGGFVPPLLMGSLFGHGGDYRNGLLGLALMAMLVGLLAATLRRGSNTPALR
jgi:NNP family nitrate/nitrite transporter-like MFS transporter